MKKIILIIALMMPFIAFAQKAADRRALFNSWNNYEVSTNKVGTSGTKFIKVWGFGKKVDIAVMQAKKNAVHACIFRGIPGNGQAGATPALYPNASISDDHLDYFYDFFETAGDYLQFVNLTTDGMPSGQNKLGIKGGYKVGIDVQVMYDNLRKKLIADGIIKGDALGNAKKPKLMVVPADIWCNKNGFVEKIDNDGKITIAPDYETALSNNTEVRQVITAMNDFLTNVGYAPEILEQHIKKLHNDQAINQVTKSIDGSKVSLSMADRLKESSQADIVLDLDFEIKRDGPKNFVEFTVTALDSYTSKPISSNIGRGTPTSSAADLVNQLQEAVLSFKDKMIGELQEYFNNMVKNGREIIVSMYKWQGSDVSFQTEYDGEELNVLIEDIMAEETVNGSYNLESSSPKMMKFSQVRMPLFYERNGKERAMDAKTFGQRIAKKIRNITNVDCGVDNRGLGEVVIYLGGKMNED